MLIKPNKEKGGIALILSILILSTLTVIGLTIASMVLQQLEMARLTRESVGAYQAADSGIEYASYVASKLANIGSGQAGLVEFYAATGLDADSLCPGSATHWFEINSSIGSSFCLDVSASGNIITGIKAIGEFKGRTRRAIEIGSK
jgi:hypothetical protein